MLPDDVFVVDDETWNDMELTEESGLLFRRVLNYAGGNDHTTRFLPPSRELHSGDITRLGSTGDPHDASAARRCMRTRWEWFSIPGAGGRGGRRSRGAGHARHHARWGVRTLDCQSAGVAFRGKDFRRVRPAVVQRSTRPVPMRRLIAAAATALGRSPWRAPTPHGLADGPWAPTSPPRSRRSGSRSAWCTAPRRAG